MISALIKLLQKLRQLRNIRRDPPRLVFGEHFRPCGVVLLGFVERAGVMRIVIHHRQAALLKASVPERPIALPP
jgi:hypothetical protein